MSKFKAIDSFFKRKEADISKSNTPLDFNAGTPNVDERCLKSLRIEDEEHPCGEALIEELFTLSVNEDDVSSIEVKRDPGLRPPMWDYPVNQRDEIRRAYLKHDPYQLILQKVLDQQSTLVAFKLLGSHNFLGLNILVLRMLHIVYHVIFFL
jgi:hypothetical protein